MINELLNGIRAWAGICLTIGAIAGSNAVAYKVGCHNRDRYWAKEVVPRIRHMERLNALAPKEKNK